MPINKYIADIIIPHHDRDDLLTECLAGISKDVFNVVVSSGGTFAQNCNKGAQMAKTETLIFLNDDTVVSERILRSICKNEADITGIYQIIPLAEKFVCGLGFRILDNGSKTRRFFTENPEEVFFPSGFFFKIKKEVWKKLGGFDESFKNGCEDSDLFLRAIEMGFGFDYVTDPAMHYHSQSEGRTENDDINRALLDKLWDSGRIDNLLKNNSEKIFRKGDVLLWKNQKTKKHKYSDNGRAISKAKAKYRRVVLKKKIIWALNNPIELLSKYLYRIWK